MYRGNMVFPRVYPLTLTYLFVIINTDFYFTENNSPFVDGRAATYREEILATRIQSDSEPYQGDIILTEEQKRKLTNAEGVQFESTNQRVRRKITTDLSERWELPINYTFDGTHGYSERKQIRAAIFYWSSQTCIRFQEISYPAPPGATIVFTKGSGCKSYLGYVSGMSTQQISIAADCLWMGTIAHEIGHTLGFWHEHARPDRDDYVTVLSNNVMGGWMSNFRKSNWGEVMSYGVPYDVGSLMHYGSKFFSRNNELTIQTKDPRLQKVLGQRDGLSFADTKLANAAYCSDICQGDSSALTCKNDGYLDPLNCSNCRCPEGLGGPSCETVAPSTETDGCGGILTARNQDGFLQSPGYPRAYGSNVRCNWLIQAPPGYRIYFEFIGEFSVTEDVTNDACVNYIEVRYYDSMSHTGGRFCGSNRPKDTMISQGSQLLLLFRANEPGNVGFKARYHTEVCGGCLSSSARQQKACARTVTYPCMRRWRSLMPVPCIRFWGWLITDCGSFTYQTKSREDTCSRTEWYCCEGFRLEGGMCRSLSPEGDEGKLGYEKDGSANIVNETRVIPVGWSGWSPWSGCSKACGGCGRRRRTRQCPDTSFCGGQQSQEQSDPCNDGVCPDTVVQFCLKKYPVTSICNPWTLQTCTRYNTKMETCHVPCCQGYVPVGKRCIKSR